MTNILLSQTTHPTGWVLLMIAIVIGDIALIWAFIDCVVRKRPGSGKALWLLIIFLTFPVGPIVYLLAARKPIELK